MTEALVKTEAPLTDEQVAGLLQMDINKLSMVQRSQYLYAMAKRAGLDPALKPFDMLPLGGKLVLYANSSAADQLREIHKISIETVDEGPLMLGTEVRADVYVVRKKASIFDVETGTYRTQTDVGAIDIMGLKGEALANAIMKAHTKADRRVTLGIKGLGIPDVSELESIPGGDKEPLSTPRVITVTPSPAPEAPEEAAPKVGPAGRKRFPPAVAPVAG